MSTGAGHGRKRTAGGYLRFADTLKLRREQHSTVEPDLVLRECVLRRRAVQSLDKNHSERSVHERFAILDEARDAIERTLHEIEAGNVQVARTTKQSLVTERAARTRVGRTRRTVQ